MEKKKKQHYVPQLQLRQFAYDRNKYYVWVLDKNNKNIRSCRIIDVCEENYFYNIPISQIIRDGKLKSEEYNALDESCVKDTGKHISELTEEEINAFDYSIENYFSDFIEPNLSMFIETIINATYDNNKRQWNSVYYFIDENNKHDFSWFIAKEFIRTKHHRDTMTNLLLQSYKKMIPITAQMYGLKIDEKEISVNYSKEQIRLLHANSILDDNVCDKYASILFTYIWILIENNTNEPFCCIDNALMMCPTEEIPSFYGYGLATYGMTLYFPISPKHMLVMHDRVKFADKLNLDKTVIKITDVGKIEKINRTLIISSYKYVVFNKESIAKKYKSICDKNPYLYTEAEKGNVN